VPDCAVVSITLPFSVKRTASIEHRQYKHLYRHVVNREEVALMKIQLLYLSYENNLQKVIRMLRAGMGKPAAAGIKLA
jgi:hypothetical protein